MNLAAFKVRSAGTKHLVNAVALGHFEQFVVVAIVYVDADDYGPRAYQTPSS
jgi:hypothetical protein